MKKLFLQLGLMFAFQMLSLAENVNPLVSLAEKINNTILSAPPMKTAPSIDGTIGMDEWKEAVKISGCGWKQLQDPREFSLWMGYDESNLYFAVRSELPPGGKLLTKARLGQDVGNDDSVEFVIRPPDERQQGPLQFGFFQMIINSEGFVWGQHHEPGWGLSTGDWKPSITQKHSLTESGFWEIEMSTPLKDMGIEKMKLPSHWKFLVARNFKFPNVQASITPSSNFKDKSQMALLNCDKDIPIVQISYPDWKTLFGRKTEILIFNPSNSQSKVSLSAVYVQGKTPLEKKEIALNAGEKKNIVIEDKTGHDEKYELKIQIEKGGDILFFRDSVFVPKEGKTWTNLDSCLKFSQSFNNGLSKADLSTANLPEAKIIGKPILKTSADGKGKHLFVPKGASLKYAKENLSVPGSIFCKIKPEVPLAEKQTRIYWKTEFSSNGYMFLHESDKYLCFGMQYFPWMKDKNSQVILWKKPAAGISGWLNVIVNLEKESASMFVNGVLAGRTQFAGPLTAETLGGFDIGVTDPKSENDFDVADLQIYDRSLSNDEVAMMGLGKGGFLGRITYFPSLKELVLEAETNPYELPKEPVISFIISDSITQEILKEVDLDIEKDFTRISRGNLFIRKRIQLPDLKDGEYVCFLKLESKVQETSGTFLGRTFIVKKYPWEDNAIGTSRKIVPPFIPMTIKGNEVSCLLRKYVIGDSGFPDKIIAKDDAVLSSPVDCVVISGGKELAWKTSGVNFTEKLDDSVKYSSESENAVLKMKVSGEFDYDGLLKLTLKFSPKNKNEKVDSLYLDIPVRKEIAKLFHASGSGNRSNPAGYIPKGEGIVWKSRSIPHTLENFIPYIWVGEEEKGVCYAADWDKDWVHSSEKDAVELIRKNNGDVLIRLNLVNGTVFDRDREIVISLMATPIKPMPEGWRGWSDNYSVFGLPGDKYLQCLYSCAYYGSYFDAIGRYPAFQDFEVIRKLEETRLTGKTDGVFQENYLNKIADAPAKEVPMRDAMGKDKVKIALQCGFNMMKGLSKEDPKKTLSYFYTCCYHDGRMLPEYEVYKDEWEYRTKTHMVKSYRDYSLYYTVKMIESGMGGIYLDNTALAPTWTWPTGDGYIDDEGNVKPSFGLWRMRDFIKRLAVMFTEMGKAPFIYVHDTNALILPAFSFATATMDMEWKYGDTDFQERFPADYFRAIDTGRQGGFFPTCIDGIVAAPEKRKWLTRTMLACFLPHEIQATVWISAGTDLETYRKLAGIIWDFGKSAPDTKFIPYWDENSPVKPLSGNLIPSAYLRGDKMLLVIGNYGGDENITIKIDSGKLGFAGILSAMNCETRESLTVNGNDSFSLPIKKHDIAIVELGLKTR
jgi:hypothetical protein